MDYGTIIKEVACHDQMFFCVFDSSTFALVFSFGLGFGSWGSTWAMKRRVDVLTFLLVGVGEGRQSTTHGH